MDNPNRQPGSTPSKTLYHVELTIGDWSEDGHGEYDRVPYVANYPVSGIRQAYKDSCRLTGVQFNHNENYMDPSAGNVYGQILTEYGDNYIHKDAVKILREYGVITDGFLERQELKEDGSGICMVMPEDVADIIMRFIALSMPKDFSWSRVEVDYEPVNGWGNRELNCQFGYGIYTG